MTGPYRIFFSLGLLGGFIGTLSWIPFAFGWTLTYPGTEHPHLMIGGFLFSFAVGFLMTAIPRFTESYPAQSWETLLQAGAVASMIGTGTLSLVLPGWREMSLLLQIVSIGLLILFAVPRFLKRTRTPPPSFLFVGIGVLCGLIGSTLLYLEERGVISSEFGMAGRSLFYHGMMLSLVIGVGGRLIPVLFGHALNPLSVSDPGDKIFPALAGLYFISFPIEFLLAEQPGRIIRVLLTLFVSVRFWKLFQPPVRRGALPMWLRIAGILLVLGQAIHALFPGSAVHGVHLTFAGGYALLTLLVAAHVVLSHGGYDLAFELKSRSLHVIGVLIVTSAAARFLAPLAPKSYAPHLGYASIEWSLGVLVWGWVFLPRMRRVSP